MVGQGNVEEKGWKEFSFQVTFQFSEISLDLCNCGHFSAGLEKDSFFKGCVLILWKDYPRSIEKIISFLKVYDGGKDAWWEKVNFPIEIRKNLFL